MITRIELVNFMAHEHTVLEPAAGLTVLVGPNNCGKSAVVAALQILCQNGKSEFALRHGERECSVSVATDDGHSVQWRRKNSPSYLIDGEAFDRLGRGGLPDVLHRVLRLPAVEGGDDADFDVHFGTQKAPIFLLGNSAANAAKFFASSSDAIRLVQMQKRHKEKLQEAQREKNRLEAESRQLNEELAGLAPVVELDRQLKGLEREHGELLHLADEIAAAEHVAEALAARSRTVSHHAAELETLAALAPPPALEPTEPLIRLIADLQAGDRAAEAADARSAALVSLPHPPVLQDVAALDALCRRIAELERDSRAAEQRARLLHGLAPLPEMADASRLAELTAGLARTQTEIERCERQIAAVSAAMPPPVAADASPLETMLTQWEAAVRLVRDCEAKAHAAHEDFARLEDALRKQAEGSLCPVCGSVVDVDRLLASSAASVGVRPPLAGPPLAERGGHDHG